MDALQTLPVICSEKIQQLCTKEVDYIYFPKFASPDECNVLTNILETHPRRCEYGSAQGVSRVGVSLSDARKSGDIQSALNTPHLLSELAHNTTITRLMGQLLIAWPYGLNTLMYESLPAHRLVGRSMVLGALPHDDAIFKDIPAHYQARNVEIQIGINLYVHAEGGGALEGWRQTFTAEEYNELREAPSSYGLSRQKIGDPSWSIEPKTGDLIMFRNSEVHAISPSKQPRLTLGCFLGWVNNNHPLFIWS